MRSLLTILTLTVLASCSTHSNSVSDSVAKPNPREYQVGAYLWQQTSGEYRALTYQAYNIAKERVERDLEDKHNKKRAVIFDIDETVLDNSFGGAMEIREGLSWKENHFAEWVKMKQAIAIPGALDFVKFLEARNVEIFYITNRASDMFQDTFDNLKAQGFPVKKENLMPMPKEHTKEPRRLEVLKKYSVVLYVGDNLSDFPGGYEKTTVEERNALVDKMKADFGQKFIILPNPLYGDWERALPANKSRYENLKVKP
ncbi:5'-nucleotidase, lipoprotein e(P4) family [Bacteriovorax sp. PP10]|uniref:5'-nucleotidase, lipoprotein e(P4) family n=1 Tax=Bacteriovorax antarcticus TaxID=3088717 RepID=A0ABU5VZR9_9BACT|nr:5'-nucleotidase, lipoprotein e(P4) family [Bacteriovorax sp. PP10]MEA9358564.1 5'-nucleotidase, lipoprotein e(P4) family [Bacteriovorax sp. PP10]